ncbi:MAG: FAD-dependent oxidoreductase [Eubacteriales bacterium]|nr:FAD-dependent oxidoreductase [Eubacteriales bacterium]
MEILMRKNYEVVVVGGGIGGICAAVAAARGGVSVLLMEKLINLGGLATAGLISWYEPLCDGKGNQLIYGLAEEVIHICTKYSFDNLPEKWGGSCEKEQRNDRYSTMFSPTVASLALEEFVLNHGVDILFDVLAVEPVMEENQCRGVFIEEIGGRKFVSCRVLIDGTGTAVMAQRAGIPTRTGKNYMTYIVHEFEREMGKKLQEGGGMHLFRRWMNSGSDMFGNGQPDKRQEEECESAEDVTQFVEEGKRRMLKLCMEKERDNYDLLSLPWIPQIRTIRRIQGAVDFTAENGKKYADTIGICGDFRGKNIGNRYEIPFGALFHPMFPNILVCGRIISAPQGDGWEVARVIPVCALTGEAAGKAAALVVKRNVGIERIRAEEIRVC